MSEELLERYKKNENATCYARNPRFWYMNHNPTSNEVPEYGIIEKGDIGLNEEVSTLWLCEDATPGSMIWLPLGNTIS